VGGFGMGLKLKVYWVIPKLQTGMNRNLEYFSRVKIHFTQDSFFPSIYSKVLMKISGKTVLAMHGVSNSLSGINCS
jgi:hypothetical protein